MFTLNIITSIKNKRKLYEFSLSTEADENSFITLRVIKNPATLIHQVVA